MRAHPAADIFPMMTDAEIAALAVDIKENGQRFPVITILDNGETLILDGRNRYRACEIAGIAVMSEPYGGDDPFALVVGANLHRRHLSASQRAMVAAEIARMKWGGARTAAANFKVAGATLTTPSPETTQFEAAKLMGVSRDSVMRARKVKETGVPELQKAVADGRVAVKTAAVFATLPPEEQRAQIANGALHRAPDSAPPPPPSSAPTRIIDRAGKPAKEVRDGVLRVLSPAKEIPHNDPRVHYEKHERIRALAAEGHGPKAIVEATGYAAQFVQHSLSKYARPKKGILDGAIIDAQTFADTWSARAWEKTPRWLTASLEERQALASALEDCVKAAKKMITRLNKEAEQEKSA